MARGRSRWLARWAWMSSGSKRRWRARRCARSCRRTLGWATSSGSPARRPLWWAMRCSLARWGPIPCAKRLQACARAARRRAERAIDSAKPIRARTQHRYWNPPQNHSGNRMLESELIEPIAAENPHLYQRDVEIIVNTILGTITAALARGDRVELRDFGVFAVKTRRARTGRNPRNGAQVPVSEKVIPTFKTSRGMHRRLNPNES